MRKENIKLRGISWDHSRGYVPLVATAQRFHELNPHIEIYWEKRSLQEFADKSIQELAEEFDLLVIDHPWAGHAARHNLILPLEDHLPKDFMQDQLFNSIGSSFESYRFENKQMALAIDAATPVASYRPDILEKHGKKIPSTLEDLLELAADGLVLFPCIPQDTLMNFYMMCAAYGEDPFLSEIAVINKDIGTKALKMLRRLGEMIDKRCFDWNPIQIYEAMANTDNFAYCPFAYGYSNYSRIGYASNVLYFHDTVTMDGMNHLKTTLGGTGLAVSASCKNVDAAMAFVKYSASAICQRTLFFDNGGQPGHLLAWKDDHTNEQTNDFFRNTLAALQRAFLRPRYDGHMYFQDHAGMLIREYMLTGGNEEDLLNKLNELYKQSLSPVKIEGIV
jgi:multiple sugar transport system substrate-binding protein